MNSPETPFDQASLDLADWRRRVGELFVRIRADADPEHAHESWRTTRDELFRTHPQSPLPPDDPLRETGLPYWPYDPSLRFDLPLLAADPAALVIPTGGDDVTRMHRIGRVELPTPIAASLDVWWLDQYAGGLFVPLRDGSSGDTSYGGGRYLLDTAKSADLGGTASTIVIDLNFAYHPSCRYNPAWVCPLAPPGNTITPRVDAGERMS